MADVAGKTLWLHMEVFDYTGISAICHSALYHIDSMLSEGAELMIL